MRAGPDATARAAGDPRRLLAARELRVRPGLDDKRLTVLERADDRARSPRPAPCWSARTTWTPRRLRRLLLRELRDDDGRLLRTWKDGRGEARRLLEDHAFLLEALLTLYEATFDARWFTRARELADTTIERFGDAERGGFFSTADDHEPLVARRKDLEDTPIPSGTSAAALGLLRLARLTGEARYEDAALGVDRAAAPVAARHPPRSATCCRRSTSSSPTRARGRARRAGPDAARCASCAGFRPHVVLAGGAATGRPAARRPRPARRPRRRLRVRALRLPGAGDRARHAREPARLNVARPRHSAPLQGMWNPSPFASPSSGPAPPAPTPPGSC